MQKAIDEYFNKTSFNNFDIKAVLFDMDGVLFDSMKWHAKSWKEAMDKFELASTSEEFFLYEGMIAPKTIDKIIRREEKRPATEDEKKKIYEYKTKLFQKYNDDALIPYSRDFVQKVTEDNLTCTVVTGSGQKALLGKLDEGFPNLFRKDLMVTAYDVKYGKPDPEPYLMGLRISGNLKPNQAIVIENAPRGVESAVAAGVFTIAVNTGPIKDEVLYNSGANIVFSSMEELYNQWDEIKKILAIN